MFLLFRLTAPNSRSASSSTTRRSRPSPSPTRRSRPTTQATIPVGGHTSVKMSTKRKSPGRTLPPGINRSISADPRNKSAYNRSMSAEPNLNDPEIQAKIGNRMTKTVDKQIGKCGICMKPVTVEGCTAFGKVYHKECFKCCVCKKRIDGKFFEKNGKPYCAKDYEVSSRSLCGTFLTSSRNLDFFRKSLMNAASASNQSRGIALNPERRPIIQDA